MSTALCHKGSWGPRMQYVEKSLNGICLFPVKTSISFLWEMIFVASYEGKLLLRAIQEVTGEHEHWLEPLGALISLPPL